MTTEEQSPSGKLAARGWRPSSSAAQRMHQQAQLGSTAIVDDHEPDSPLRALLGFLARPFVRIVIGLALFIFAALVYDATINYGSWTEKAEKLKASEHRGMSGPAKPQKTPD